MKGKLRNIMKWPGKLLSHDWLARYRYPIFLPFYHVVSDEPLPHVLNYPYRNSRQFEAELDFLLKHFRPVGLADLLNEPHAQPGVFHLSFDDGLRQCATLIAPVLLRKGIPATFFVNPGFTDNRELFHRYKASLIVSRLREDKHGGTWLKERGLSFDSLLQMPYAESKKADRLANELGLSWQQFLDDYKPYMTLDQIRELESMGFTIGGHSWDHPEFAALDYQGQYQQVADSMAWIGNQLQQKHRVFAFPYTDDGVSSRLLRQMVDDHLCDLTFGTAGLKFDSIPGHLQRFPVETKEPLPVSLKMEMFYSRLRGYLGRQTVRHP